MISPRLASYMAKKGFSLAPKDATQYVTDLVNEILSRRRKTSERRNDFLQIMVDHEQEVASGEQKSEGTEKQEDEQQHQWGTLKKSMHMNCFFF